MPMFSIYDGRTSFWQWDLGQKLIVSDDTCCEVHFDNGTTDAALVCEVFEENGKRLVNVPNILLQSDKLLQVFAYVVNEDDEHTIHSEIFKVQSKAKPEDYVYTETEIWSVQSAVEKVLEDKMVVVEFDEESPASALKDGKLVYCRYGDVLLPYTGRCRDDFSNTGCAFCGINHSTVHVAVYGVWAGEEGRVSKGWQHYDIDLARQGELTALKTKVNALDTAFIAQYDVTPYEDILAAWNAGKRHIWVEVDGADGEVKYLAPLSEQTDAGSFAFREVRASQELQWYVSKGSGWGSKQTMIPTMEQYKNLLARVEALENQ